jgi:hypothetical protein
MHCKFALPNNGNVTLPFAVRGKLQMVTGHSLLAFLLRLEKMLRHSNSSMTRMRTNSTTMSTLVSTSNLVKLEWPEKQLIALGNRKLSFVCVVRIRLILCSPSSGMLPPVTTSDYHRIHTSALMVRGRTPATVGQWLHRPH